LGDDPCALTANSFILDLDPSHQETKHRYESPKLYSDLELDKRNANEAKEVELGVVKTTDPLFDEGPSNSDLDSILPLRKLTDKEYEMLPFGTTLFEWQYESWKEWDTTHYLGPHQHSQGDGMNNGSDSLINGTKVRLHLSVTRSFQYVAR
jgi:hypothetical protein